MKRPVIRDQGSFGLSIHSSLKGLKKTRMFGRSGQVQRFWNSKGKRYPLLYHPHPKMRSRWVRIKLYLGLILGWGWKRRGYLKSPRLRRLMHFLGLYYLHALPWYVVHCRFYTIYSAYIYKVYDKSLMSCIALVFVV